LRESTTTTGENILAAFDFDMYETIPPAFNDLRQGRIRSRRHSAECESEQKNGHGKHYCCLFHNDLLSKRRLDVETTRDLDSLDDDGSLLRSGVIR
jgi:hypothetical protein